MAVTTVTFWDEQPGAGRLGRHAEHDDRSRAYAVDPQPRTAFRPEPVVWRRCSPILDQGSIGSCTGNAITGWLGCEPHCNDPAGAAQYDEHMAVSLYELATRLDRIPGYYSPGDPASEDTGSTGLAVAKAAKRRGLIGSYGWVLTVAGMLWALRTGPVIVGSVWTARMDRPDRDGFVTPSGAVRGGHEYLVRGWQDDDQGGHLVADNSWGTGFGCATDSTPDGGSFKIRLSDWALLRKRRADVTVPKL